MAGLSTQQKNTYPLQQLYFYLTEGCNLACRHCWLAPKFDTTGHRYQTLPKHLFEQAILEAKPLGLNSVKLTGGEPLLHPQFIALLEIIRKKSLALVIETNGILCTPDIAREIAKNPSCSVSVSIDGADAVTHETIRGISGSFALARQAVRNLTEVNIRPQIIMSLMRDNMTQVDDIVHMAENLNASSVKFNLIQPTGRGKNLHKEDNVLDVQELLELGHYIDTTLASQTSLPLFFDYPLAFQPLHRIAREGRKGVCGILGILGVVPRGHYALCGIGEVIPELVFGTVGKNRLEDVWQNTEMLSTLRDGLPEHLEGVCADCLMKFRCLGACLAQNYYRTNSFWQPFWFCEQAEQQGLFPRTRLAI